MSRPSATRSPAPVPRWLFYEKIWFWLAIGLAYAAFSGWVERTLFAHHWTALGPHATWDHLRVAAIGWGLSGLCTALALIAPRRFTARFFRLAGEALRLWLVITAPSTLAARHTGMQALGFSVAILGSAVLAVVLWTVWDVVTGSAPHSLRPPPPLPSENR